MSSNLNSSVKTKTQIEYFNCTICNNGDGTIGNDVTIDPNPSYLHFLAQDLNNQGCVLLSKGDFAEAINHLKSALEMTRIGLLKEGGERKPCSCRFCRIESFLKTTTNETEVDQIKQDYPYEYEATTQRSGSNKRKRTSVSISVDRTNRMDIDDENDDCFPAARTHPIEGGWEDEPFVYQRPMFVSQYSIDRYHYMGTTLSFIILFNIALAHHLNAIMMLPFLSNRKERIEALQQALKLYELAYQLHLQSKEEVESQSKDETISRTNASDDTNAVNLRLTMLVTNNISQIHKLAGNITKYHQCLEYLLNAIMFMSQNNAPNTNNNVLTASEKDAIFENLSPILKSNVFAPAA